MKKILVFAILFLWSIMFGAMHLVTFDLFGDNLWFHYVIAGSLLLAQLAVVVILQRTHKNAWCLFICFLVYFIFCIVAAWFLASAVCLHDPSPQGLTIWCIILDLAGACFCFFNWLNVRNKTVS